MSNRINRELVTAVGPKFLAVSNQDLIATLESALPGHHIDVLTPKNHASGVVMQTALNDFSFNIPELGGLHVPRLFLRNANDGGLALTVGVGLFRSLCLNGLYSGFAAAHKIRHIDGPKAHETLDLLPATIAAAVESIKRGDVEANALDALETSVADPIAVVGNLPGISLRTKDRVISSIALESHRPEDRPETAWGLYQIINETARKNSRSMYRAALNDMQLLDNILVLANDQVKIAA